MSTKLVDELIQQCTWGDKANPYMQTVHLLIIHFILFELNRLLLTKKLLAASWKNFPHTVTHFLYKNQQDDSNQLPFLKTVRTWDHILTLERASQSRNSVGWHTSCACPDVFGGHKTQLYSSWRESRNFLFCSKELAIHTIVLTICKRLSPLHYFDNVMSNEPLTGHPWGKKTPTHLIIGTKSRM